MPNTNLAPLTISPLIIQKSDWEQKEYNSLINLLGTIRQHHDALAAVINGLTAYGTTAQRPTLNYVGQQYFDTTLGTEVTWNGSAWIVPDLYGVSQGNVGRNLVDNSMWRVQQTYAGAVSVTNSFVGDRWIMVFAGTGTTMSCDVAGFADAARTAFGDEEAKYRPDVTIATSAATGVYCQLYQGIEDIRRTAGKTLILSFWIQAPTAGYKVAASIDQYFGTGGTPSAYVYGVGQLSPALAATTWTRVYFIFNMPSVQGKTIGTNNNDAIYLNIWFAASSDQVSLGSGGLGLQSGTFQIWGVQLEVAQAGQTLPTAIEKIAYVTDLDRCQRFFQYYTALLVSGVATAASQVIYGTFPLRSIMFTTPNVVYSGIGYSNASALANNNTNAYMHRSQVTCTAAGVAYGQFNLALTAPI